MLGVDVGGGVLADSSGSRVSVDGIDPVPRSAPATPIIAARKPSTAVAHPEDRPAGGGFAGPIGTVVSNVGVAAEGAAAR